MLAATGDTPLSNLYAVDSSGQLTQAVTSGSATIQQFLIAPNGDVYTLFAQAVNLSGDPDAPAYCLLAQVDRATGVPTCIDSTLSQISWRASNTDANPAIQFDASGRIYYAGYTTSGTLVLRRFANGTSTNLITDNVWLQDFLVLPDGTVFLTGPTTSTGALWLRRLAPDGSLHSLSSQRSYFMKLFPDGNVYLGMWGGNTFGVQRYLTGTDTLESKLWIGDPMGNSNPDVYNHVSDFCPQAGYGFCGYFGSMLMDSFTTSTGSVYGLAGTPNLTDRLMEYYPVVQPATSAVDQAHVAAAVGDKIALAGLNSAGQNILTLYDPSADTESQLIGPDHEIEIYHAEYVPSSNSLLFDGLRFSDNTYIVGDVNLATGTVTTGTTINGELADLQTF
jgi:hypothetical protein